MNIFEIIITFGLGIISSIIAIILWDGLRIRLNNIANKVWKSIKNPYLSLEISENINLKNVVDVDELDDKLRGKLISSFHGLEYQHHCHFKFNRKLRMCTISVNILPMPEPDMNGENQKTQCIRIVVRARDIKYNDIESGILDVNNLLNEVSKILQKNLDTEGSKTFLCIDIKGSPLFVKYVKDLDLKYLNARKNGLEIFIYGDKIKIVGKIESETIGKIKNLMTHKF